MKIDTHVNGREILVEFVYDENHSCRFKMTAILPVIKLLLSTISLFTLSPCVKYNKTADIQKWYKDFIMDVVI